MLIKSLQKIKPIITITKKTCLLKKFLNFKIIREKTDSNFNNFSSNNFG